MIKKMYIKCNEVTGNKHVRSFVATYLSRKSVAPVAIMNLFDTLIYGENFMCVYRNYKSLHKSQKIIAITRIIVELSLSIAITVNNVIVSNLINFDYTDKDKLVADLFKLLVLLKSLVIVIGGIVNSESFSKFYENLGKLHSCFKDEVHYKTSEKRLKVKCCIGFVVFTIMGIILMMVRLVDWYVLDKNILKEMIVLVIYELWTDIRYTLEHLVVYCAITYTYDYLKCLNNAVNEILKKYNEQETNEICLDANEECINLPEKVNSWTEKYQHIMACCKNISLCYQELVSN